MRSRTIRNGARRLFPRKVAMVLGSALLAALFATAPPAATALPTPTTTTTAPDSDPVPAPPGANDWSCRPTPSHPYPVVLVHGTFGNRWQSWQVLSPMLQTRGYCVFALDYGGMPGGVVTNDPTKAMNGLAPVVDSVAQLATFVQTVLASTGADKVDIVGHSQGGMMPNYYLKFLGGADKVHTLVGMAPDNHGTTMGGLALLMPGGSKMFPGCPACSDQIVGSAFLKKLNGSSDTMSGVHYTVVSTMYDMIATPYQSQYLTGPDVVNDLVQSHCPFNMTDHMKIITDATALHYVTNALDPAHATPVTCG